MTISFNLASDQVGNLHVCDSVLYIIPTVPLQCIVYSVLFTLYTCTLFNVKLRVLNIKKGYPINLVENS